MASRDYKKYYWLKLDKGFFKRHDIQIVESMPNGKDYILFYLKLLCESTSHEGALRFSDAIPYSDTMLATITNTNVDIVRSAIKIFTELQMMELLDDGTIFMNEVTKMIGSETGSAIRKREYRSQQKELIGTNGGQCLLEIEKEIEIDKEKDIYKGKSKRFTPPTIEEVSSYCYERNNNVNPQKFIDFYQSKDWMVGKNKMKDWKACVRTWEQKETKEPRVAKEPTYSSENNMDIDEDILKKYL